MAGERFNDFEQLGQHFGRNPERRADGGRNRQGGGTPLERLPDHYKKAAFFDQAGVLRPEFLVQYAREVGGLLKDSGLTANQLRRFYGEVRRIERRIRMLDPDSTQAAEQLNALRKLVAVAQSAVTRDASKPVFAEFIDCNVARVQTARDLVEGFAPHFECVVGFAGLKDKNR